MSFHSAVEQVCDEPQPTADTQPFKEKGLLTTEKAFRCNRCRETKPGTCFYGWGKPTWRNFFTCKPCHNKNAKERAKCDVAARLHARLYKVARYAKVPLHLSCREIREMLALVPDPALIEADRLALCPVRAGEQMSASNIALVLREDIRNAQRKRSRPIRVIVPAGGAGACDTRSVEEVGTLVAQCSTGF